MGIKSVKVESAGLVGVAPRVVYISTDNTLAEVTATGYLNDAVGSKLIFTESDMALVSTKTTPSAATTQVAWLEVSKVGSDWSLVPTGSPGSVILPTVADAMTYFNDTLGTIQSGSDLVTHAGALTVTGAVIASSTLAVTGAVSGTTTGTFTGLLSGLAGVAAGADADAGSLTSFPATTASGSLALTAVDNAADHAVVISNVSHGQATTYNIVDVGEAAGSILVNPIDAADINANTVTFDVTIGQAALATAGTVTLQASSGAKQYKIRELYINSGGTDFSGGGGDRLATISDGTTDYSIIPAASLQSLVNGRWGDTTLAFPAGDPVNTSTVAAANLTIAYSGGGTDYTAGSMVISGVMERVA